MHFSVLPPEVLKHILRRLKLPHLIKLSHCGDSKLSNNLERSIESVNWDVLTHRNWPSLFDRLSRFRTIRVTCPKYKGQIKWIHRFKWFGFGKEMREIRVKAPAALSAFIVSMSRQSPAISSLSDYYPHLVVLKIRMSDAAAFDPALVDWKHFTSILPNCLLSLTAHPSAFTPDCIEKLPPRLEKLKWCLVRGKSSSTDSSSDSPSVTSTTFPLLPKTLTKLEFVLLECEEVMEQLKDLRLITLTSPIFPSQLHSMPPTLTCWKLRPSKLPSSSKVLDMDLLGASSMRLEHLQSFGSFGLKNLANSSAQLILSQLKVLRGLSLQDFSWSDLPESLTWLQSWSLPYAPQPSSAPTSSIYSNSKASYSQSPQSSSSSIDPSKAVLSQSLSPQFVSSQSSNPILPNLLHLEGVGSGGKGVIQDHWNPIPYDLKTWTGDLKKREHLFFLPSHSLESFSMPTNFGLESTNLDFSRFIALREVYCHQMAFNSMKYLLPPSIVSISISNLIIDEDESRGAEEVNRYREAAIDALSPLKNGALQKLHRFDLRDAPWHSSGNIEHFYIGSINIPPLIAYTVPPSVTELTLRASEDLFFDGSLLFHLLPRGLKSLSLRNCRILSPLEDRGNLGGVQKDPSSPSMPMTSPPPSSTSTSQPSTSQPSTSQSSTNTSTTNTSNTPTTISSSAPLSRRDLAQSAVVFLLLPPSLSELDILGCDHKWEAMRVEGSTSTINPSFLLHFPSLVSFSLSNGSSRYSSYASSIPQVIDPASPSGVYLEESKSEALNALSSLTDPLPFPPPSNFALPSNWMLSSYHSEPNSTMIVKKWIEQLDGISTEPHAST